MNLVILGAGPGGYVAALKASQLGAKVTVIEKDKLGGTCLNWGCIPTKAIIASTDALRKARKLEDYGIDLAGNVSPNLTKIMERKEKIVSDQTKGIKSLFKSWGINIIDGQARLLSPQKVAVEKKDGTHEVIEAQKIIIATGSRPAPLPLFPFDGEDIISYKEALSIKSIPKSLLIIGAGVIGSEFAFIFSELGSQVTMFEIMPRAISTEDHEISDILHREFKKRNIKLFTSTSVKKAEKKSDGIHVYTTDGKEFVGTKLLVAVGFAFNTEGIGLEDVGIKLGQRGEITVNERMETNIQGIFAIGDVTGGMLLAHKASQEGIVAAYNACGFNKTIDYSVLPAAIFTSPEIGSVGLRQHQAEVNGLQFKTGHFQFRTLGKAHAMGEITGIFKIIADARTDRILGVHIIGPHASDLIHEGALAMKGGVTANELADMMHAHPTLSEGFREAAQDLHGMAIHAPKRI